MRLVRVLTGAALAVFLAVAFTMAAAGAPPDNDDWTTAIAVAGASGSTSGKNVEATTEAGEPVDLNAGVTTAQTVWWKWIAPASTSVTFAATGADAEPTIGVFTGASVDSLTEVASDADSGVGLESRAFFDADAGTTYYLQVGAYPASTPGSIALTWGPSAVSNDDFAAATPLGADVGQLQGWNVGAGLEPGEPSQAGHLGATVWYAWTPATDGVASLELAADFGPPALAAYTGTTLASLTAVDSGSTSLEFDVAAGTTYFVQLGADEAAPGTFSLGWKLVPRPGNDALAAAPTVSGGRISKPGSTTAATLEAGEPTDVVFDTPGGPVSHSGVSSVWYRWTPPASGPVDVTVVASSRDDAQHAPLVKLYEGPASAPTFTALTSIGTHDTALDDFRDTLRADVQAGQAYYIQVMGDLTSETDTSFDFTLLAGYANDRLADAAGITGATGAIDGSTQDATTDAGEPLLVDVGGAPHTGANSVWYRWSPLADGTTAFTATAPSPHQPLLALYRGPASAPTYGALVEVGTNAAPATARLDAAAGDTYYVQVMSDVGSEQNPSFVFSLAWASAPGAPALTAATPSNASVTLDWSAAAANGSPITGYRVYRGTSPGAGTLLATIGNVTAYTDTTAVNRTTYFYEVGAVNAIGEGARSNELSATPANPATRDVTGTVRAASGAPLSGIAVRACLGATCFDTASDANGGYAFLDLTPGTYVVRALPSDPALLVAQAVASTAAQSVANLDLRLLTSGSSSSEAGPSSFVVNGCTGRSLHFVATADGAALGSGDVADGAGGTPVDGLYTIDLAALAPGHVAKLQLDVTLACAQGDVTQTAILFTDPSGTVVDDSSGLAGAPLGGATVTLLDAGGNPIPAGDPRLSPATAANPQSTDARGAWAWDVAPGTYVVRAEKAGCGTTMSGPLVVTPSDPATGVTLHLSCASEEPPPPPPVTPPPPPPPPTTLPEPVAGESFNVVPLAGTVLVNGAPLSAGQQIPFGAVIDATKGTVAITTIGPTGDAQTAQFSGGAFQLTLAPDGVTTLVLKGGDFTVCAVKATANGVVKRNTQGASAKSKQGSRKVVRQIWGDGKGKFRTKGRYSSATVRGTNWLTADRCDGTFTRVREGTVTVLDSVRSKTLTVRAGHSVLVRPK